MNEALLLLRLVFGLTLAAHGSQKLFGWFGGYGLSGTGGFMESLGFRPGRLFAFAAGFSEFTGGLLIALGFLGPIGSMFVIATMLVATVTVHWKNGFFAMSNGIELTMLYAVAAAAIALAGPGRFSIDTLLGLQFSPLVAWGAIFAGIIGGLINLGIRQPPATAKAKEV